MIRRPPRSTLSSSSAASDVYKRQRGRRSARPQGCSRIMSPRGVILVVLCACIVVIANLLLRMGLDRSGVVPFARGVAGLPGDVVQMLMQPVFCIALVCYGLSM